MHLALWLLILLLIIVLIVGVVLGVYAPAAFDAWVRAACAKLVAAEKAAGGDLDSLFAKLTTKKVAAVPAARAVAAPAVVHAAAPQPAPVLPGEAGPGV